MRTIQPKCVACFGFTEPTAKSLLGRQESGFHFLRFSSLSEFLSATENNRHLFQALVVECKNAADWGEPFVSQLRMAGYGHLPLCLLADSVRPAEARTLQQNGVREVFVKPLATAALIRKLQIILQVQHAGGVAAPTEATYHMPLAKRLFDLFFASLALLLLSPLFALIALLIRLESRGPVFYYSLRVGTGYRVFRFYKFRSMAADAEKKLSQLKHLNQYAAAGAPATQVKQRCNACAAAGTTCHSALYADNDVWCEKLYKEHLQQQGQQAFIKIKDDPRITRVGRFIRNTSIDELPQLWNVLKGDMSLVGNRPLPLYEAEKLTTDKFALRFMAPAGITGLWQVSKRGRGAMSEEERISLDNDYAKKYGLFFDIKLLLRTIPALLQKENV